MVVLPPTHVFATKSTARLLPPLADTSSASTSATADPTSFRGLGLSFIDIRPAHLDFIAAMMGRSAPEFSRIFGAAMVNRHFLPLGFSFVYFEDDCISVHAYYGPWLKRFPKDIMRHQNRFTKRLRELGHYIIYACADENIEGSDVLIRWFKGRDTGRRHDFGRIYEIDLRESKI